MPRLLLFAATTGYQTTSFAAAARSLSVDVVLATDRCHIMENPWGDNALAVRFEDPEGSAASLAERLQGAGIDGVIAVADRPTLVAALTAEKLGLPWHPPHAAAVCRDKHKMRQLFSAAGLPVPSFRLISLDGDPRQISESVEFPCVLKPLSLSGSRGVIRVNDREEFVSAFARIRKLLAAITSHDSTDTPPSIQVENYIPGREFAVEGVLDHGHLASLAIFDKPDPLEGPFFEETIYVTPSRETPERQREMLETTSRAALALGLRNGPIHAEMRVNEQGVFMLEIAARPIGGLCSRVLRFLAPGHSQTLSLEEVLILHATGQMPLHLTPATPSSGVMMIPVPRAGILQSVSGTEEALSTPGIEDVIITARPGEKLTPLPEGASYTGFLFARGSDPGSVEESLRRAHGALRFDILSALDVLS